MKIWVIGRDYPREGKSIEGSFEVDQARMLQRAGHEVAYLTMQFHPLRRVGNWGSCSFEADGLPVFAYSQFYPPRRMHVRLESFQRSRWNRLFELAESQFGRPDVIHVHYPTMIPMSDAVLDYREKGVKVVATEHWSLVMTGSLHPEYQKTLRAFVRHADTFICVSSALRDGVYRAVGDDCPVEVVPNVVSTSFSPAASGHEGVRFICIGRLTSGKQIDQVIAAFASQFAGREEISLLIVGGGEEYQALHRLAEELGVLNQVTFAGVLDRSETASAMQRSDALVCYSRLETFCVPVIEAWASGLPVIASEVIPAMDYCRDGMGEKVPLNDVAALGEAMKRVTEQLPTYDRAAIAAYAQANFSEEAVCRRLEQIYKRETPRIG